MIDIYVVSPSCQPLEPYYNNAAQILMTFGKFMHYETTVPTLLPELNYCSAAFCVQSHCKMYPYS